MSLSEDVQRRIVSAMLNGHPWPWKIEPDWTVEVIDARGQCVLKCMSLTEANSLVTYAGAVHAWMEEGRREMEALLKAEGIEP